MHENHDWLLENSFSTQITTIDEGKVLNRAFSSIQFCVSCSYSHQTRST